MRILPSSLFRNSKRLLYEFGGVTAYAEKNHGAFEVLKSGTIVIKNAKKLGVSSDTMQGSGKKLIIVDSDIVSVTMHGSDVVKLHNCKYSFPKKPVKDNRPFAEYFAENWD